MITCLGLSPSLDVTYRVSSFAVGEIHRPELTLKLAGGKALNAARVLATMGRAVTAIVPLGGFVGDLIEAQLAGSGIRIVRTEAVTETRFCVTVADDSTGALTEVYEPSGDLGVGAWAPLRDAIDAIEGGWLALSGSVPDSVPLKELVAALAAARDRGIRLAVDVHGVALDAILSGAHPDLVKVNRHEAAGMPERPADVDAMLHVIRARGVGIAVVTDGAAGSYALGVDGRRMHAVSTAPPGRYSVGSGDSYLAGLVAALDDGADLADALRLATACGVANTRVPGAGVLTADAIAEERQRVRVDDVDGEQK